MSYPALPDRRIPWHDDGTVVYALGGGAVQGLLGSSLAAALDGSSTSWVSTLSVSPATGGKLGLVYFFPELRIVRGFWGLINSGAYGVHGIDKLEGSSDTTNGVDGTWETAALSPSSVAFDLVDGWRGQIVAVTFTESKRVVRATADLGAADTSINSAVGFHLYGHKDAGQTPDDILFLDGGNAYAEFTIPEDFGDVPLTTAQTRTFKIHNASSTKTAGTIALTCTDADVTISSDGTAFGSSVSVTSLAPGTSSAVLYVRCAPAGPALGPRFAEIACTVGTWT